MRRYLNESRVRGYPRGSVLGPHRLVNFYLLIATNLQPCDCLFEHDVLLQVLWYRSRKLL